MKWLWGILLCLFCSDIYEASFLQDYTTIPCIQRVVEHEAGNQSLAAMRAVEDVVLERMKRMRQTCIIVALQPAQFSGMTYEKLFNVEKKSLTTWEKYSTMRSVCSGCSHFHRDDVKPSWAKKMKFVKKIDRHLFYKEK